MYLCISPATISHFPSKVLAQDFWTKLLSTSFLAYLDPQVMNNYCTGVY